MSSQKGRSDLFFYILYLLKSKLCICVAVRIVTITRQFNPFKHEFAIVLIIHYKPWIAVAILEL